MRSMAVKAKPFFGWGMGVQCICIKLPVMTGKTKGRGITLQESPGIGGMAVMAGHTITFAGWLMHTKHVSRLLTLLMTVLADICRRITQHTGIFAGMRIVTRLTVALFDRLVLCSSRDIVMTCHAEPALKGLHLDRSSLDLMAIVAVAVSHRRVDYLPEQSRIAGTVLCMAVNTPAYDWILLMGCL